MAIITAEGSMLRRRNIIILGGLGILGHLLGIVADIGTGYAPGVRTDLASIASLSLANIAPLLQAKPLIEVRIGHYLAIFFIPLGLFGMWQVYRALLPARNRLALPFLLVGGFGLIYATFYHGTLGFIAAALQAQREVATVGEPAPETMRAMLAFFNSLSEPLGSVLMLVDLGASLLFAGAVWFGDTRFPRWLAAVNPLSIQLVLSLLIWFAPHPLQQLLWLTVFNLSLALWYLSTTAVLLRRPGSRLVPATGADRV